MLSNSEIARLVRGAVLAFLVAIIISTVFYLALGTSRLEVWVTSLMTIFGLFFVPPFLHFVQDAFTSDNDVQNIVRNRLKENWIEGYLRTEERAISSSSTSANARNPESLLEDMVCDLPTLYEAYSNDMLELPLRSETKSFDYYDEGEDGLDDGQLHLHVSENETLITIFNQFTNIVRKDESVTGEFILVLGYRGTRKSLQLLKLAEYLVDRDSRVPIYLNVFSWAAGSQPFHLWLQDEIRSQYDLLPRQAKRLIEGHYLILLLDGFEEVPFSRREYLVRSLGRFLQARVDSSTNGDEAPADLRDAVVIASLFPPQWLKKSEGDPRNPMLYWEDRNDFLKLPAYENFIDLDIHLQTLVNTLQGLEDRTDITHKAPVAALKILTLPPKKINIHLICHLERKALQGNLIYKGVRSMKELRDKAENSPYASNLKKNIADLEKTICQDKWIAYRKIRRLEIYDQLMSVLTTSPFVLRAFISTFSYQPQMSNEDSNANSSDKMSNPDSNASSFDKLNSSVIDGMHYEESPDLLTFDKIANIIRVELDELHELFKEFAELVIDPTLLPQDEGSNLDSIKDIQQSLSKIFLQLKEAITNDSFVFQDTDPDTRRTRLEEIYHKVHNQKDKIYIPEKDMRRFDAHSLVSDIVEALREVYIQREFHYRDQIRKAIIRRYIDAGLRDQPGNVGPLSHLSREEMLQLMARGMQARQQRVLDRGDVVFYLEDIGQRLVFTNADDEERIKMRKEYNGYVAFVSVCLFFIIYGLYLLVMMSLSRIEAFNTPPFSAPIIGTVAILLLFFARFFGWHSSGPTHDKSVDRSRLNYPVRWYSDAGVSAGLFMGIIIALLFFGVSEIIYGNINRDPLRYEAVIVGFFSFALFFMLGGMELGRRFAIVARPEDGQRFLLLTTLLTSAFWLIFFFVFLFWPRTRFDLLTPQQVIDLVPVALSYSVVNGLFIGVMSALVFSHLYIRHLILFSYLRAKNNLQITYRQVLEHNAEVGFLRKVGGGYIFRHRLIMDHFSDKEARADYGITD